MAEKTSTRVTQVQAPDADVRSVSEASDKSASRQEDRALMGADRSVPDSRLAMHPSHATKVRGGPIGPTYEVGIDADQVGEKRQEDPKDAVENLERIAAGNPNTDPRSFSARIVDNNRLIVTIDGKEMELLPDEVHHLDQVIGRAKMELVF